MTQRRLLTSPPSMLELGDKITRHRDKLIVLAEKSQTYATMKVFQDLFDIRYRPSQHRYEQTIYAQQVTILYMDLSELKDDRAYETECRALLRDCDVLRVICFEYCNPRVQEIDQNIHALKRFVDIDSVVYVFYADIDYYNSGGRLKENLVRQMKEYLECRYIDNLEKKVFMLDHQLKLEHIVPMPPIKLRTIQIDEIRSPDPNLPKISYCSWAYFYSLFLLLWNWLNVGKKPKAISKDALAICLVVFFIGLVFFFVGIILIIANS